MTQPDAPLKMPLDAIAIRKILPHRYPFLLVDRVLSVEPGKRVVALKLLSVNEPFFQGHFPNIPVMPGVLQIEALAQAGAIAMLTAPSHKDKLIMLAGVDEFKFRRPVLPGDVLTLEVEIERFRSNFGRGRAKASVDGDISAEGVVSFAMMDAEKQEAKL